MYIIYLFFWLTKTIKVFLYGTLTIFLQAPGLIFWSTIKMTIPLSSRPLRPARPLIWIYSPEDTFIQNILLIVINNKKHKSILIHSTKVCALTHLKSFPSNFLALVNNTVLAGIFRPIANVSVANKACEKTHRHINYLQPDTLETKP